MHIRALNIKIKQRLIKITETLDFKHSSHKPLGLLKRMRVANLVNKKQETINPNRIATRLTKMGKQARDNEHERIIKLELRYSKKI